MNNDLGFPKTCVKLQVTDFFKFQSYLKMLKHRYSMSRSPNVTLSCDDIVSGNISDAASRPVAVFDNLDINFDSGDIKTSTKRNNMEEDLRNVWDVLNKVYKQQIERENSYLTRIGGGRRSDSHVTLDESEIFAMDRTRSTSQKSFQSSIVNVSPRGEILWNDGDPSCNAVADPWVIRYKYDDDGYKIYEDVEFNSSFNNKTLEGSFSSDSVLSHDLSDTNDKSDAKLLPKKRNWKRSLSKVFTRNIKRRNN